MNPRPSGLEETVIPTELRSCCAKLFEFCHYIRYKISARQAGKNLGKFTKHLAWLAIQKQRVKVKYAVHLQSRKGEINMNLNQNENLLT